MGVFRKKQVPDDSIYSEKKVKAGEMSSKPKFTVAVAGAMRRLGATTQALHITNYLFYKDKKVAYVELNDHGFIDLLETCYQGFRHDRSGNLVWDRLTLVRKSNLASVMGDDYDTIVYDYGAVTDPEFPDGFEERNVQILVCGNSPEEIARSQNAFQDKRFQRAKYIFSFCPPDDSIRADILKRMSNHADDTFFARYAPDFFSYPEDMEKEYARILPEVH